MVLPGTRVEHLRPLHLSFNAVADKEIVDPPSRIVGLAGPDSLRPPGVDVLHISVHVAERVNETFGQKIGKSFSLLICKSGRHVVGLGMSQIDLLMRHVEVTARDHGFLLIQLRKILRVAFVPFLSLAQPLQAVSGVRCIDVDKIETSAVQNKQTPFVINCARRSDSGCDLLRLNSLFIKNHCPRITLSGRRFRADPLYMIAREQSLQCLCMFFGWSRYRKLCLLYGDDIGVLSGQCIQYVSGQLRSGRIRGQRGVQGIYIPGYEFGHVFLL